MKQETAELDRWDTQLAHLKKTTPNDERYKTADDLQLQLKDLRGDLQKLKTTSRDHWDEMRARFETKLASARKSFRQVEAPARAK